MSEDFKAIKVNSKVLSRMADLRANNFSTQEAYSALLRAVAVALPFVEIELRYSYNNEGWVLPRSMRGINSLIPKDYEGSLKIKEMNEDWVIINEEMGDGDQYSNIRVKNSIKKVVKEFADNEEGGSTESYIRVKIHGRTHLLNVELGEDLSQKICELWGEKVVDDNEPITLDDLKPKISFTPSEDTLDPEILSLSFSPIIRFEESSDEKAPDESLIKNILKRLIQEVREGNNPAMIKVLLELQEYIDKSDY